MNRKRVAFGILVSLIVTAAILGLSQKHSAAQAGRSSPGSDSVVLAKLAEVLDNQKTILAGLASVKEELQIIKIRITQAQ